MSAPDSNVLAFPPARSARLLSHVTLHTLDGRVLASASFLPGDPGAAWEWVVENAVRVFGCAESEVGTADGDLVTVGGIPAYMVEIVRPAKWC